MEENLKETNRNYSQLQQKNFDLDSDVKTKVGIYAFSNMNID